MSEGWLEDAIVEPRLLPVMHFYPVTRADSSSVVEPFTRSGRKDRQRGGASSDGYLLQVRSLRSPTCSRVVACRMADAKAALLLAFHCSVYSIA